MGNFFQILSSKVHVEIKHYDCCPAAYPSVHVDLKIQRRFVVTPSGVMFNPLLSYNTTKVQP